MPTTKPRLQVTLTPESRVALEKLAQASGVAASQWIRQIIADSVPMLDSMTRAFEAARKSPLKASEIMNEAVAGAMMNAAQAQLDLGKAASRPRLRKRPVKRPA